MVVYSESVTENGKKGSRIIRMDMTSGEKTQLSAPGSKVSNPVSLAMKSGMLLTAWLDHSDEVQKVRVNFSDSSLPQN